MDPRLDSKADVGLVRMIFEHTNARLDCSLHRRDENVFNVEDIHFWSVRFGLGYADRV